jgi:hypothetical protein
VACTTVRGKPSSTKPHRAIRTVQPIEHDGNHHVVANQIAGLHRLFRGAAQLGAGLNRFAQISPVEIFGSLRRRDSCSACVPLPAPGRPSMTTLMALGQSPCLATMAPSSSDPGLLHEPS